MDTEPMRQDMPDDAPPPTGAPWATATDHLVSAQAALQRALAFIKLASDRVGDGINRRMPDTADLLNLFAVYDRMGRTVDAIEKALAAEMSDPMTKEPGRLHKLVLAGMERSGMQNVRIGNLTLYTHRQIWASAKDLAALKSNPATAFMVQDNVNSNTLSAWVREHVNEETGRIELPPGLDEAIGVTERFAIRSRMQ